MSKRRMEEGFKKVTNIEPQLSKHTFMKEKKNSFIAKQKLALLYVPPSSYHRLVPTMMRSATGLPFLRSDLSRKICAVRNT